MPRYNTKPIDYEGCDPIVAEHLKRGEAIECEVWDAGLPHEVAFVDRFSSGCKFAYHTHDNICQYARPIPIKRRRIMPPELAIPVLIAGGWKYSKNGWLMKSGEIHVQSHMFEDLGKLQEYSRWHYPDCIIEEVDE